MASSTATGPSVVVPPGMGDFDGVKRSRISPGLFPRAGSADSHRSPQTRDLLRRGAQRELRNNYLLQSLIRRMVDTVVGDKLLVQVKSSNPKFNTAAEKFLNRWKDRGCDYAAPVGEEWREKSGDGKSGAAGADSMAGLGAGRSLLRMARSVVRSAPQDGSLFVQFTDDGRLNLIEDELVRDPAMKGSGGWGSGGSFGSPLAGTPETAFPGVAAVKGGVCFDANGRIVGYSVSSWDPRSGERLPRPTVRFVPAKSVLHLKNPADDDANVTRPEPGLTGLVEPVRELRNYIKDVGVAAKLNLLFGLVVKSAMPDKIAGALPQSQYRDGTSPTAGSGYEPTYADLEPGFILNLGLGEEAMQVKPEQPMQVFSDFVMTNMAMIAAAAGVPLALWSLDFRGVNFSSAKGSVALYYASTVGCWREWLSSDFLKPVCRERLAMAIRNGELDGVGPKDVPDDWDQLRFLLAPPPALDPLVMAQADAYRINQKLSTVRDVIEANGRDYEQFIEELTAEHADLVERDLRAPMLPGQADFGAGSPAGGGVVSSDEMPGNNSNGGNDGGNGNNAGE